MGMIEKTQWGSFVSARLSPAIAASIGSYFMTQASIAGLNFSVLGIDSEAIKGSLVFGLTILFTDPMFYVRLLASAIVSVRRFWGCAKNEVEGAINKPLETEKKE